MAWTYIPADEYNPERWVDYSTLGYPLVSNTDPAKGFADKNAALESLYLPMAGGNTSQMQSLISANPDAYSKFGINAGNAGQQTDSTFYDRLHNIDKDPLSFLNNLAFLPHAMGAMNLFSGGNLFGGAEASGGNMDWWGTDYMGDFGFPDVGTNPLMPAAVPESPAQLLEWGLKETAPGMWEMPGLPEIKMGATDWLKYGGQAISKLFGGDSSPNTLGGLGSLFGTGGNTGGLFGSLFGNNGVGSFLDKAAASAPVLAAIQYARNQNPLDTGKLESLYGSYDPNALAFGYDQNTMAGRDALTSSLTNRGVMGSSFGNNDLTNFNTTRDLGRSALINQGMGQRADVAKAIMDANFKSQQLKNNLYGSSLLALGNVFGGRSSPTLNFGGA